jgi:hypothetical protein
MRTLGAWEFLARVAPELELAPADATAEQPRGASWRVPTSHEATETYCALVLVLGVMAAFVAWLVGT